MKTSTLLTLFGIASFATIMSGCKHVPPQELCIFQRFEKTDLKDEVGIVPDMKLAKGEIVPGKNGNALHIAANTPGAAAELPDGMIGIKGCVEFWAKIDNGNGNITGIFCPSFFSLIAHKNGKFDGTMNLAMTTNEGHGMSGLAYCVWGGAYSASHKGCSSRPYSDILKKDPAGWHHYAFVWNFDTHDANHPGKPLAIYIDGTLRYDADWQGGKPTATDYKGPYLLADKMTLDISCEGKSTVGYTIDELKVWSIDRRKFDLN